MPVGLFLFTIAALALGQWWLLYGVPPSPATLRLPGTLAASPRTQDENFLIHGAVRVGTPRGPRSSREARGRGRDPLKPHRAIVGRDTRTPWYIRARAFLALLLIVICLSMAVSGFALLIIASGRFVIEVLAG